MYLEMDEDEYGFLVGLLESRVTELHPEIRRSRDRQFKDGLKQELDCLTALLDRLRFQIAPR